MRSRVTFESVVSETNSCASTFKAFVAVLLYLSYLSLPSRLPLGSPYVPLRRGTSKLLLRFVCSSSTFTASGGSRIGKARDPGGSTITSKGGCSSCCCCCGGKLWKVV